MTGYIIGLVLGIIVFLLQNLKPTSFWFRILFLILTIAFFWAISYAHAVFWNILIIPIGVLVLCFVAAFCFPYGSSSARNEYMAVNGRNYYLELQDDDNIGRIDAPGFKQTYDRIIAGVLTQIVRTQDDFQRFGNLLYSKNFYPISIHTKEEVMRHINSVITEMSNSSKDGRNIRIKAENNIETLFNTYVSVMSIHEEATRRIKGIEEERRMEDDFQYKNQIDTVFSEYMVLGVPSHYADGMELLVTDKDGVKKPAMVVCHVRKEKNKYMVDENSETIAYLLDGFVRYGNAFELNEIVVGYEPVEHIGKEIK